MGTNSIREQILDYHVTQLKKLSSITTVKRVMQTYSTLGEFAVTQFPVAAVVGGLPVPNEKMSDRARHNVDVIISDLAIETYIYIQNNDDPDQELSNIADDVWVKLYSFPTYNALAFGTILSFKPNPEYWAPFLAFNITSTVQYKHSTGGI